MGNFPDYSLVRSFFTSGRLCYLAAHCHSGWDAGLGNVSSLVWMEGDAESLTLDDNSMDGYTIAFGIRNVTHIDRALKEAHRCFVLSNTLQG